MDLSKRLQAIVSLVTPGHTVADIGTDHGYVPIALLQQGKCDRGLAMDIGKGPLARAEAHIRSCLMEDRIRVRLSDGMDRLKPGEADRIVIAGMGGPLMARILKDGEAAAKAAGELILSPQSELGEFRRFLFEHKYVIKEEVMLEEDGKYYVIFRVVSGEPEEYTEEEYAFGKKSLIRQECLPVRTAWIEKEIRTCRAIIDGLSGQESEAAVYRRAEIDKKLKLLEQIHSGCR